MSKTVHTRLKQCNGAIIVLMFLTYLLAAGSNVLLATDAVAKKNRLASYKQWMIELDRYNPLSEANLTRVWQESSLKKIRTQMSPQISPQKKPPPEKKERAASIAQHKGNLLKPVRAVGHIKSPGMFFRIVKNTPVKAIHHGTVVYADWFRGYGFLVILNHGDRVYSLYGHNDQLLVSKGDRIKTRQVIAKSGNTGTLHGIAGLYFEIRRGNKPENPNRWLVHKKTTQKKMAKVEKTQIICTNNPLDMCNR